MSFSIFPLWLVGVLAAAAASIPIIIHLLHRQRTQPVLWGAMQFLKESPLQQKRRKKVDHWLLMLLRIAAAVLVVLLLAWPKKDRKFGLLGSSGGTDIAVVLDHSLSTGRRAGNSTAFGEGVNSVDQFVHSGRMKANDTLSVVLAEHQPRKMNPVPPTQGDLSRTIDQLKKMKPGLSDGPIPEAIQAAREVLARGRNARKAIVVISDQQRTGWKVQDMTAWNAAVGPRVKGVEPDVKVYTMGVTPDAGTANVTVTDLTVTPQVIGTSRAATITATVLNSGATELGAQTAKLLIDGKQTAEQKVPALSPGQSQTIHFENTFTDPRSNYVTVQVDAADSLEADNSAVASAYIWQDLPVLIVDGNLGGLSTDTSDLNSAVKTFKSSRYLVQAMLADAADPDAPPLVKPTIMSALDSKLTNVNLNDYAAIVLNDVPRLPTSVQGKLADYARAGHGVWIILGRNSEPSFIQDGLAQAGLFNVQLKSEQKAVDKPPALDVKDPQNAMLEGLAVPEHNVLQGVNTYRWWALDSRTPDAKTIVAAAGTGDPLILERPMGTNGGRVIVWTTTASGPAEGGWNNWPAMKMFPPLVNLTVYHLAAGQTKGMENRRLDSGQPIVWTGPATPTVNTVDILRPDGSKIERKPVTRDGRQILTYRETYMPGKYELRFDQSVIPQPVYYGVGIDRSELEPATLTADDVKWLTNDDHKYVAAQIDASKGLASALGGANDDQNAIWPWLAGFVLATLIGETYMTYRMIKRQTDTPGVDALMGRPATA